LGKRSAFDNPSEVLFTQNNLKMDKQLLEKYCRNICNDKELRSVLTWFEESAETAEGKAILLKI